jgi:hypothetical protein
MKVYLLISLFFSQIVLAQETFNFKRDLPLILKAQEALKGTNCSMRLENFKDNIFVELRSKKKSDASNFHSIISMKEEKVSDIKISTIFTTTWFQNVLFSQKKFVTKLIIDQVEDQVTSVKMKTRESGATIYSPVLRFSTVKCQLDH